jgi:hypothetical protein
MENRFPKQTLGGERKDENQKLLFIHISKSISLNMRFRAAPENSIHLSPLDRKANASI